MIAPCWFHDPPVVITSASEASQSTIGVPPLASTRLSLPAEKKPTDRPVAGGDQHPFHDGRLTAPGSRSRRVVATSAASSSSARTAPENGG
jgi:hypothetical protein